jgi:hypothetical protein
MISHEAGRAERKREPTSLQSRRCLQVVAPNDSYRCFCFIHVMLTSSVPRYRPVYYFKPCFKRIVPFMPAFRLRLVDNTYCRMWSAKMLVIRAVHREFCRCEARFTQAVWKAIRADRATLFCTDFVAFPGSDSIFS